MVRDANGRSHDREGRYANENRHNKPVTTQAATDPYEDEQEFGDWERIGSLMQDYVPMKQERSGKVPVLNPDDDSVKAQSKLARYLNANFDGDREQADITAIENLYGGQVEDWHDSDLGCPNDQLMQEQRRDIIQREIDNMKAKTSGDVRAYWDGSRAVFVADRKKGSTTCKPACTFSRTGMPAAITDFGSLQAANMVANGMEGVESLSTDAKEKLATGLLYNDRKTVVVSMLGTTGFATACTGVLDAPMLNRRLRIRGGNPPEPPHVKASLSTPEDREAWDHYLSSMREGFEKIGNTSGVERIKSCQSYLELSNMDVAAKYRESISSLLRNESNSEMNKAYVKRANSIHSATVYEDKKNQDPAHVEAGRRSEFAKDFGHIEVDDGMDLKKFHKLSNEYADYKRFLPRDKQTANLRFRMTGRHHATGTYHPTFHNIAVDPRHPSSFTHEYFHHLDWTSEHGRQVSMDPDFQHIVRHYQETVDQSQIHGDKDNYLAPTEIFARAGELWMHERVKGKTTNFLSDDKEYQTRFDYQPLNDMHDEVMAFMDRHFGNQ